MQLFSESFRCGLFFADPTDDSIPTVKLPVAPLFIMNNSWTAPECQSGGGDDRFSSFCNSIVSVVESFFIINLFLFEVKSLSERITLFDPSLYAPYAAKGLSIGDDICG